MHVQLKHNRKEFSCNLSKGIDLSIPIRSNGKNLQAWYLNQPKIKPVKGDGFIGSVEKGGSVNFRTITFNPHAHGTHTESYGHITKEIFSVNKALQEYFFIAQLISVNPVFDGVDSVISDKSLSTLDDNIDALIIRTLPNEEDKKSRVYSNTNPPYLSFDAISLIRKKQVRHLLIDTPSVDREVDGGALQAHHYFWDIPQNPRKNATITELIYVPNCAEDGLYLLNLQTAAFENDATPSRPVIFSLSSQV